jgi:hypothetical protein
MSIYTSKLAVLEHCDVQIGKLFLNMVFGISLQSTKVESGFLCFLYRSHSKFIKTSTVKESLCMYCISVDVQLSHFIHIEANIPVHP